MRDKPSILLVEDDEAYALRLKKNLEVDDFAVDVALGGKAALDSLARTSFDLVITDVKMPDMNGLELIEIIRKGGRQGIDPEVPIVVLTSINSVDTAVGSMKLGAADYITKESDRPEIVLRLKKVLEQSRLVNENLYLRAQLAQADEFSEFIGVSEAIKKIKSEIAELAPQGVSVLLLGETGVGKELVARALHRLRGHNAGPFVDVNCAAMPDDNLIQSELFGHEMGAFTGATAMRKGKFELAVGGSLFFDEISELSHASQGKILKVIENRSFTRLGGTREIKINCRFLFATNKDLFQEMRAGHFREDLYYRVNIYPIVVPPLRERREDIEPLARYYITLFCRRYNKSLKRLDARALERLMAHPWPGNVRELRNIMERLVIRIHGVEIKSADLVSCGLVLEPGRGGTIILPPQGVKMDKLEEDMVRQALERSGWNQKVAAGLLGFSVDQMNSRVRKYGLTHPSWLKHKPQLPDETGER